MQHFPFILNETPCGAAVVDVAEVGVETHRTLLRYFVPFWTKRAVEVESG